MKSKRKLNLACGICVMINSLIVIPTLLPGNYYLRSPFPFFSKYIAIAQNTLF